MQFVPGYRVMQRMAAQLIRECIGDAGTVLVLGAGGGLELEEFASRSPGWRFVGVEPADGMATPAQERLRQAGARGRLAEENWLIDPRHWPFDFQFLVP